MIPAVPAGIGSFLQRMFRQPAAHGTDLGGRESSFDDMDAGTVFQFRFDDAHGRVLDLPSEQSRVPVVDHLILDRNEIVAGKDLMNGPVRKIFSPVAVFLIRFAELIRSFVMIPALPVSVTGERLVHSP